MDVQRNYDTIGETRRVKPLTLTESLLLEILLQVLPSSSSNTYIDRILVKVGLTDEEIATARDF